MVRDYPTDADLVWATRSGDKQAFGQLVERYLPMSKRIALHIISHEEISQELAQEAMLQAYLSLDHLREPDHFQSWLYGIVRNVCHSYLRSQKADLISWEAGSGGMYLLSQEPSPHEVVEKRELYRLVQEALALLSTKNKVATWLFYYEQLSTREIATLLGISVAAVKDRLYQSRQRLRVHLAPAYGPMPSVQSMTDLKPERRTRMIHITSVDASQVQETEHYIVYLADTATQRVLPIWVGLYEGHQIAQSLRGEQPVRPMTFHFMANLLNALGAQLQEVQVKELRGNIFYAVVKAHSGETRQELDARPSDAIALALHTHTPIFVSDEIMAKASRSLPQAVDVRAGLAELHRRIEESHRLVKVWRQRIEEEPNFAEDVRRTWLQTETEALNFNHNYVGTEHLLLSLVRDGENNAAQVLRALGIELEQMMGAMTQLIGRGELAPVGEPMLVPRLAQVLEFAAEEQHKLGHPMIGTGHLLLGLVQEGEGMAITILRHLQVDLDQVRTRTLELITLP
jgi:RNA polymerase sigma factor (sigma-70 family)